MVTKHLSRALASAALAALCTFAGAPARAHFILDSPASWMSQGTLGDPQKAPPCGDEPGGTATGVVTPYKQGETITIQIRETIYHPGHYRVALSVNDRSELPPEPVVKPDSMSPCGSAPVMSPPVFPVLADGVLEHSKPFSGMQTIKVTLPSDITCDHCTLQIIEFMSNHGLNNPGGCYYHHCADISISAAPGPDGGAGGTGSTGTTTTTTGTTGPTGTTTNTATGAGGAGGSGGEGGGDSDIKDVPGGCGCSTPGDTGSSLAGMVSLLALSLLLRKRR